MVLEDYYGDILASGKRSKGTSWIWAKETEEAPANNFFVSAKSFKLMALLG